MDTIHDGQGLESRIEGDLDRAAAAISRSQFLVAFTGAGVSVESGIPPFRGPGGLWESYDSAILDIDHFNLDSLESWKAIKALFYDHWGRCSPNRAHTILGDWEKQGRLKWTITQNIDALHQRGGASHVSEFHGTLATLACRRCGNRIPAASADLENLPPHCPSCKSILKPDFVFFGEGIPEEAMEASSQAIAQCDCLLVIGTSGEVYPAAMLPEQAKRRGAVIIELNPRPSAYTARITDIHIPLGAVAGMTALEKRLSGSIPSAVSQN